MEPRREATIKIHFGAQGQKPTDEEIFNFFKEKKWSAAELSAMYRENYCVFVRFQSVILMRRALEKLGPQEKFTYADGKTARVNIFEASGAFKYVRIFGLPPEVEDIHIAEAMGRYGKIHHQVRERFAEDTGFPIWNGVRGLLVEVMLDIPPTLRIQHVEARIYYDGLKNKCFMCGESGHLKAGCPKKIGKVKNTPGKGSSFADVLVTGTVESQQPNVEQVYGNGKQVVEVEQEYQAAQLTMESKVDDCQKEKCNVFMENLKQEQLVIPPYKGKKKAEDYHRRSRSRSPLREACTDDESW